ncbi:MAG: DUF4097 family beta strand repeat-containing protein [Lachnospira sp.]
MKKAYKIWAVVASCCIIAGIILVGIGLVSGGNKRVVITKKGIEVSEKKDFNYETDHVSDIEDIKISLSNAELEIKASEDDSFYVVFEMEGIYNEPEIVINNKTISIYEKEEGLMFNFDFNLFNLNKRKITVYIPDEEELNEIAVDTDNGMITSKSRLSVRNIIFNSDNGAISMENVICTNKAEIESCNGAIKIQGEFSGDTKIKVNNGAVKLTGKYSDNLYVKSDNGKVSFSGELKGESVFRTSNGAVEINVEGEKKDYKISAEADNGSVRIDGKKVSNEYFQDADKDNSIDAKTNNGSVSISF